MSGVVQPTQTSMYPGIGKHWVQHAGPCLVVLCSVPGIRPSFRLALPSLPHPVCSPLPPPILRDRAVLCRMCTPICAPTSHAQA